MGDFEPLITYSVLKIISAILQYIVVNTEHKEYKCVGKSGLNIRERYM